MNELSDEELLELFECVCAGGMGGIGDFAPQNNITPKLYEDDDEEDSNED